MYPREIKVVTREHECDLLYEVQAYGQIQAEVRIQARDEEGEGVWTSPAPEAEATPMMPKGLMMARLLSFLLFSVLFSFTRLFPLFIPSLFSFCCSLLPLPSPFSVVAPYENQYWLMSDLACSNIYCICMFFVMWEHNNIHTKTKTRRG